MIKLLLLLLLLLLLQNFKEFQTISVYICLKRQLNERQLCGIKGINDTNIHNERLLSKESYLKAVRIRSCTSVS